MASTTITRLAAFAAAIGPVLLFVYFWSEDAFGPSQPNGGPLRMALGFQLVTGALLCFAIALLRLNAQGSTGDRAMRLGTLLGYVSVGALVVGSALWWPVLFLWPDFGPVAGAAVALGTLSLFATWLLVGLRALRQHALSSWARRFPIALLAVFFVLLVVSGSGSAWPLVAGVCISFAVGWVLLAYAIWHLFTPGNAQPRAAQLAS